MKIGFVTDTNIIRKSDDELSKGMILDTTDIFIEYIEVLKKRDPNHTLVYFMPELVLKELFAQKSAFFKKQLADLNKIYGKIKYGLNGTLPKDNFEDVIKEEKKKYLPNFEIITLESSKELMDELVEDAINKTPPFDKSIDGEKTDSGFKDAIIWKTILNSKEIDNYDLFYFFSSDKTFQEGKEFLLQQFSDYHLKTELKIIFIKPEGNQRQKALQTIITDNNLEETEIVKLYNRKYILSQIKSLNKYDLKENIYYPDTDNTVKLNSILLAEFIEDDFTIDDVNKIKDGYEILISFKTYKYTLNTDDLKKDSLLCGNIKLHCKIQNKNVMIESYDIKDIEFRQKFEYSILKGAIKTLMDSYNDEYKKQIINIASNYIQLTKKININNQISEISKNLSSYLSELNNNLLVMQENGQDKIMKTIIDSENNND